MRLDKRSLFFAAAFAASGLAVVVSTPRTASAWPPFVGVWQAKYPTSSSDDNVISGTGAACALCHFFPTGGTGWNPYGWEVRKKFYSGLSIDDAITAAEKWDSEPNPLSWSNITEIGADTQPGWTDGPNNIYYDDSTTLTGQPAPSISGSLDPAASPMIPKCDPGVAGVQACPCGNPQDGLNRGCDNSSTTTGAALTAVGVASLSGDTLVFTTGGERPTAFTLLLQGTTSPASGIVYGQGIRCVAVNLKRLYQQSAVGGSVTMPNAGLGDPPVSVRSAAKGDTILAGEKRWYLAFYRDPTVLGGCPAASTFNATQTGEVLWAP